MEKQIIDILEQYFKSGSYQYCAPNISPTEFRTILADLKKLEEIKRLLKEYQTNERLIKIIREVMKDDNNK